MTKVYTIGYGGMTAEKLQQIVNGLNAVLVDVRFAARSRIPHWNKGKLVERFGDNYIHLNSLGNAAYRDGGMQIADYAAGRESIRVIQETLHRPVVLMCACASPEDCHRTHVADLLRADGFEVAELTSTLIQAVLAQAKQPPQLSLWSQ